MYFRKKETDTIIAKITIISFAFFDFLLRNKKVERKYINTPNKKAVIATKGTPQRTKINSPFIFI